MNPKEKTRLIELIVIGIFSVSLAYIFGSEGLEAFMAVYFMTAVLFTQYMLDIIVKLFKSKVWLIFKILGSILPVFAWFGVFIALISPVSFIYLDTVIEISEINWLIVLLSFAALVVPTIRKHEREVSWDRLLRKSLTAMLTVFIMFMALIMYGIAISNLHKIILVLTVEMQFIIYFVVIETKYMDVVHNKIANLTHRSGLANTRIEALLLTVGMGLPFIITVLVLALVAATW